MKRFFACAALCALTLAACKPGGVADTGPIKIGYVGPLTGDAATYGNDTLHGAEIKLEEINAAGGINGRTVEFIVEDTRCTGTDGASAAQKLINIDKVVAIIGDQCSGATLGEAPIANQAQIPMVSPVASSPDITNAGDFVFRIVPSDALAADATAAYLKEQKLMKVAIITENTDFATAFGRSLKAAMGADAIVFEELTEPNGKDFRTLMTRLKDVEFDVFVANAQTVATAAAMLVQLREQGLEQPTVGNNAIVAPSLTEIAGDAAEGLKLVLPPSKGANASIFDPFEAKFEEKYGVAESSIVYAAMAYDALGITAEAIGKVGTGGPAIRDYLYAHTGYAGATATFTFDANGDVQGIPFELQEVRDGKFVVVKDIPID